MGDKCGCVAGLKITDEMMAKYPELGKEEGLSVGDKVGIGAAPFDGILQGPMKIVGECGSSCRMSSAKIDGNEPGWKSEFVSEFFPAELGSLEQSSRCEDVTACYADPLRMFTYDKLIDTDGMDRKGVLALRKFAEGKASLDEMKYVKARLEAAEGKNDMAFQMAVKLLDMEIKKAENEIPAN